MENKNLWKMTLSEELLNIMDANVDTIHRMSKSIKKAISREINYAKNNIADITESAMYDFSSEDGEELRASVDWYDKERKIIAKVSTQFANDVSYKYVAYLKQLRALISSFIDDASGKHIPTDSPEDENATQLDDDDDDIFESESSSSQQSTSPVAAFEVVAPSERRISAVRFSTKDGLCDVYVGYDDGGEEEKLFDFFIDEISFSAEELIGLTEEEADALKCRKDKEYDDLSI